MDGSRIRRLRETLGWTQNALSEFLNLSENKAVARLERGRRRPGPVTTRCLEALERVSQVTRPDLRPLLQRRPMEPLTGWFLRVMGQGAS